MMIRKNFLIVFVNLLLCCAVAGAEEPAKSDLQQRAEAVNVKENIAQARSLYIRAFEDYAAKGQMQQAVECGTKGAALYYKENFYKEAFDLLRRIDASINNAPNADKSALQYYTTKERLQMYMKLRKVANAQEQLAIMDREAATTKDERVKDDLLYTKAIYYYTFGMNEKGNAVFGEMTSKLTASKAYDKVDDAYQTLITNGRRSGNSNMVAQAYSSYIAWKDSVSELKRADEVGALKQQIEAGEATIAERDSSLKSRAAVITGLGVLSAILAAALVLAILVLLRFIVLTRKQKRTIRLANENNALKAQFISNISAAGFLQSYPDALAAGTLRGRCPAAGGHTDSSLLRRGGSGREASDQAGSTPEGRRSAHECTALPRLRAPHPAAPAGQRCRLHSRGRQHHAGIQETRSPQAAVPGVEYRFLHSRGEA